MIERCEDRKSCRAKVQRSPDGELLSSCLALSAEDLSFVEPGTAWFGIKKMRTVNGLIIEVEGME